MVFNTPAPLPENGTPSSPQARSLVPVVCILIVAVCGCAGVLYWSLQRTSESLVNDLAKHEAEVVSASISTFRELYTTQVVSAAKANGIEVTHDFMDKPGAIPLPATLSMELSRRLGERTSGTEVRLFSDYPFPWRERSLDGFQTESIAALRANPDSPYYAIEASSKGPVLRYATADVFRASCVDCHDNHPDTPRRDWREGDVRGVLEVRIPLSSSQALAKNGRMSVVKVVLFTGLVISLLLVWIFYHLHRTHAIALATGVSLSATNRTLKEDRGQLREALSDLDQRNADLALKNQEAADARRAAEAADNAKTEFLATMSHEIRTPMYGILGMTQFLLQSELDGNQLEQIHLVQQSADSLLKIINDILDYTRLESGKIELERIPFDLVNVCEDVVVLLEPKAKTQGLGISFHIGVGTPPQILGDPGRVRQVLMNLINNAIKFTEHGEVTLHISRVTDGGIALSIDDTGIGIPKDRLDCLFQRFSQVDASHARKFGGTGLGLAISKALVEAMGGQLRVQSQVGVGSRFQFSLPLESALEGPHCMPFAGRHAVLVDECSHASQAFSSRLVHLGFEVHPLGAEDPIPDGLAVAFISAELMPSMRGKADCPIIELTEDAPDGKTSLARGVRCSRINACLLEALDIAALPSSGPTPKRKQRPTFHGKVLVAEDNAVNMKITTQLLEQAGFEVYTAWNGLEAVSAVGECAWDLVLMDCQMPEMDGFAATRAIRAAENAGRHVPIVAMTANAMAGDRERCLESGMDGYVSKPVNVDLLYEELKRVLNQHKAA